MAKLIIKEILKEKGLTQKELADMTGMSYAGVSKALNGSPTLDTLDRIAEVLGVETSALFVSSRNTVNCPHCGLPINIQIKKG